MPNTPVAQPSTMDECIHFALRGHAPAVQFFMLMRDVLHFWDDLIDRDNFLTDDAINKAMFKALVQLPSNAFFRSHQDSLMPILVGAIANWQAANAFEKSGDRKRLEVAFVIRSDYANLLIHAAYLVGGYEWMQFATPLIRAMWTDEDFEAYAHNLQRERAARDGTRTEHVKSWYEQETAEYMAHGLTVFNAAMLGNTESEHVNRLVEWIRPPKAAVVVDMGCGIGGVSRLMAAMDPAAKFYGVTNVKAQAKVMQQLDGVAPVLCDFHHVPLPDGVADVVMFNESIGYGSLGKLLGEAFRLLKPGGKLAIKDAVGMTGVEIWSKTWQWTIHPEGRLDDLAKTMGFEVASSHRHAHDLTRFHEFIQASPLMRSRYGAPDVPEADVQPWFWLLQKQGQAHA